MKTKKRGSIFAGLFVFLLVCVVICTVAVNLIFSGERVPRIANYYLYLQDSDEMSPEIPEKSLVVAVAAASDTIEQGNKVLCYLSDGKLAIRNIYQIEETEDGMINYYPGTVLEQGTDLVIPRTNIFARCIWYNQIVYQYVKFATSVSGLMALLVAPCVILIIMLLVRIAKGSDDDMDDEEFLFEEGTPAAKSRSKKTAAENPLYDPDAAPVQDMLEEKKSSISENFAEKPVNENSPYQKAVQEREKTMKFRRQEIEEEALRALEEPMPRKKKINTQVYSAEEIRAQADAQKQQMIQPSVSGITPKPIMPVSMPEPMQLTVPTVEESPVTETSPVAQPEEKPVTTTKPVYVSTSPNIDDILKPAELRAAKKGQKINSEIAATDSIDDLIRALEKEKNKL